MKKMSLSQLLSHWGLIVVTIASFFTFFLGYWQPAEFFWDENYHIPSAQKYLNGVHFMEHHPPLGKLLVAAGEWLFQANDNELNQAFVSVDYVADPPDNFSFVGYRFFPALLAWLTAPVLFLIFWLITKRQIFAVLLSSLYVFDNALIVNSRGALLDSIQLFFISLVILSYLRLYQQSLAQSSSYVWSVIFGMAAAAAFSVKFTGLITILFGLPLLWHHRASLQNVCRHFFIWIAAFAFFCALIWQVHFMLGQTRNTALPLDGYYNLSEQSGQVLDGGQAGSLAAFVPFLVDSIRYTGTFTSEVPRLDLCSLQETGSPYFYWPLGARAINYRWDAVDDTHTSYLYLQSNPVVWWISFAAVLLSMSLLLGRFFFSRDIHLQNQQHLIVFTGVYVSYMLAISQLDRVMYLYHYFIPLFFSFILVALVLQNISTAGTFLLQDRHRLYFLLLLTTGVITTFFFYAPLTYHQPLTNEQFARRAWFSLWELRCAKCERSTPYLTPGILLQPAAQRIDAEHLPASVGHPEVDAL